MPEEMTHEAPPARTEKEPIENLIGLIEKNMAIGVVVYRHEEVWNPNDQAYTTDNRTQHGHFMGVGPIGRRRLQNPPDTLRRLANRIMEIRISPNKRAKETASLLKKSLGIKESRRTVKDLRLTDQNNPGPYKEGWSLNGYNSLKEDPNGRLIVEGIRKEYGYEEDGDILARISPAFTEAASGLLPGQVSVMVTHEKPSQVLLNSLAGKTGQAGEDGKIKLLYGEAYLVVISPDGKTVMGGCKIVVAPDTDNFAFFNK